MQLKLLKDYKEAKAGSICDVDEKQSIELIESGIAQIDETKVESIKELVEEIVNKEINIKKGIKVMENKDMEFGLGKYFQNIAKKAITGNSETSSAADGGALVYTGLADVQNIIMAESQVYGKCDKINLSKNANAMKVPVDISDYVVKATAPVAYNPAEGSAGTASKLQFDARTLTMVKSSIYVPVTSELLEDSGAMDSFIRQALVGKMSNVLDMEVLLGSAAGYTGIVGDTGYTLTQSISATPTLAELTTATLKVHPVLQAGAEWFMSATFWALVVNTLATEKNVAMQNINVAERTLLGKKVNIVPCLSATQVVFANLKGYKVIEAPLGDRLTVSDQVRFAEDEIVFKLTHRGAGAGVIKARATGDSLSVSYACQKA